MKKVTILGLHLNYGGVEQAIANLANALSNDFEIELAITYKLGKPAFFLNSNIKITYLTNDIPNKQTFINYLKQFKLIKTFKEGLKSLTILHNKKSSMRNYLQNCSADIIVSTRLEETKLLNKYAPSKRVTLHIEHTHPKNIKRYLHKLKKACQNINYLIAVSHELQALFTKYIPQTKSIYLPNALSYFPKKPSKLNTKNLISVGRLSKEKGYMDLISIFKIINDLDNSYHLDIIGDGPEYSKIKDKITKLHLEDKITLHGFQNKDYINKCLAASSLYLMSSYEESFGIVLIEAASFKVPAIAFTSASGAKEIIKDNVSGYLIPNRDQNLYAKKALELLNNREKLEEFGLNAQNIAKEFSFPRVKDQYLKFFQSL